MDGFERFPARPPRLLGRARPARPARAVGVGGAGWEGVASCDSHELIKGLDLAGPAGSNRPVAASLNDRLAASLDDSDSGQHPDPAAAGPNIRPAAGRLSGDTRTRVENIAQEAAHDRTAGECARRNLTTRTAASFASVGSDRDAR